MVAVLNMPKTENKEHATFRLSPKIKRLLKLEAKSLGKSQADLLTEAFVLYRGEVRQKTQAEREELAREVERLFGSAAQDTHG